MMYILICHLNGVTLCTRLDRCIKIKLGPFKGSFWLACKMASNYCRVQTIFDYFDAIVVTIDQILCSCLDAAWDINQKYFTVIKEGKSINYLSGIWVIFSYVALLAYLSNIFLQCSSSTNCDPVTCKYWKLPD